MSPGYDDVIYLATCRRRSGRWDLAISDRPRCGRSDVSRAPIPGSFRILRSWMRRRSAISPFKSRPSRVGSAASRPAAQRFGRGARFPDNDNRKQILRGHETFDRRAGLGTRRSGQLAARHAAAGSKFDLVLHAGVGAALSEIFDIRIHGFPGTRSPKQAWPEPDSDWKCLSFRPFRISSMPVASIDAAPSPFPAAAASGVPSAARRDPGGTGCQAVCDGRFFELADVTLANVVA